MSWLQSDNPQTRYLATCYTSLSKVLLALKRGPPATFKTTGAAARLSDPHTAMQHVPYRDSPLTKWLQDVLSHSTYVLVSRSGTWIIIITCKPLSHKPCTLSGSWVTLVGCQPVPALPRAEREIIAL